MSGNYVTLLYDQGNDNPADDVRYVFPISRFDLTCTENSRTGKVTVAPLDKNAIYDSETCGDAHASWAFVYIQGEYWRMGAIYNR